MNDYNKLLVIIITNTMNDYNRIIITSTYKQIIGNYNNEHYERL